MKLALSRDRDRHGLSQARDRENTLEKRETERIQIQPKSMTADEDGERGERRRETVDSNVTVRVEKDFLNLQ